MVLRIVAALIALVCLATPTARAASSFIAADGVNRAPAVTLQCVGPGSVSLPCGTPTAPVVVSAFGGQPVSRTASIAAGQSTQLFPVNASRHYLAFQVPAAGSLWINFVGGAASVNGTDCVLLPAGTIYESGTYVVRGAISVYAPVAVTIPAWEG
jgi:hypothetical protein